MRRLLNRALWDPRKYDGVQNPGSWSTMCITSRRQGSCTYAHTGAWSNSGYPDLGAIAFAKAPVLPAQHNGENPYRSVDQDGDYMGLAKSTNPILRNPLKQLTIEDFKSLRIIVDGHIRVIPTTRCQSLTVLEASLAALAEGDSC